MKRSLTIILVGMLLTITTYLKGQVTVTATPLSDVSIVFGALNVDILKIQITTGSYPATVEGLFTQFLDGGNSPTTLHPDVIDKVKVFEKVGSSYVQIKFGDLTDGCLGGSHEFDVTVEMLANSSKELLLTVDIAAILPTMNNPFSLRLDSIAILENSQYLSSSSLGLPVSSMRKVTIVPIPSLVISIDTLSLLNKEKHVLAGDQGKLVAHVTIQAFEDSIEIEDLEIVISGPGSPEFSQSISQVILYDENFSELYTETVSGNIVSLNNVFLRIPKDSILNFYIGVNANRIGKNLPGTYMDDVHMQVSVYNPIGLSSAEVATISYGGVDKTLPSKWFDVIPVLITKIDFIPTYQSLTPTEYIYGDWEDELLGIVKIDFDEWTNTDYISGADIEAIIKKLHIKVVSVNNVVQLTNLTVKVVGHSNPSILGTYDPDGSYCISSELIEGYAAESIYLEIRSDGNVRANGSFTIMIDNLDQGGVVYSPSDNGSILIDKLRIGKQLIQSQSISTQYACTAERYFAGFNQLLNRVDSAGFSITSQEVISDGQSVTYHSPNTLLQPMFETKLGGTFSVFTVGCPNASN